MTQNSDAVSEQNATLFIYNLLVDDTMEIDVASGLAEQEEDTTLNSVVDVFNVTEEDLKLHDLQ